MTTIRRAVAADAGGIGRVHVESWRWAYAGLLPSDLLAGLSEGGRAQLWREILAADGPTVTFVADTGGVAGFVSVGPGRTDVGGPEVGELLGLYVRPDVAGTGVGRALHDVGIGWLADRRFGRARLWVLSGNDRARRFYERQGWRSDGAEKTERRPDGFVLDEVRYERGLKIPVTA